MDLHSGELVIFQGRPSWRSTMAFYVVGLLLAAAAGVIGGLAGSTGLGIAIGVAVFVVVLVVGLVKRLGTHYVLTNERLHIRRGLIARHIQETRLERVQNVNTDQSILERLLQIGTVDFDTAGSGDSDFAFAGVAQPEKVVTDVNHALRSLGQGTPAPATASTEPPPPAG
jgi:uncharacterized membrane protein YdbT with pleckstrin-like domain